MENRNKQITLKHIRLPWWLVITVKSIVCSLALQESTLTQLEWGYYVDIPIIKYLFRMFQSMNGWGTNVIFILVGLICIFYITKEHPLQKNRWICALSLFWGICMVIGKSYHHLGNWNYIFHGKVQFALACFVILGYYWLFKNTIILLNIIIDKFNLNKTLPINRFEKWIFESHPFSAALLFIGICNLSFLISFFPGLLQVDAQESMWAYLGAIPWTSDHVVAITWFLGQCMHISRSLLGNDFLAICIYASTQYIIQWLVFAYGNVILGKLRAPILLRWFSLIYFSIFPLFKNWGFIVVKDSFYYIFLLLFLIQIIHIWTDDKVYWWHWFLLPISSIMVAQTRNNGLYVLIVFCILLFIIRKKYWKLYMCILFSMILSNFLVQNVYMPHKNIASGEVGEVLSIPLQQTARYAKEHFNELSEDELATLSSVFDVSLAEITNLYNPELSDPVKEHFISNPSSKELTAYFKVWFNQFLKYPDTYIQAYLNQIYGYFYPDRETFWEGIGHYSYHGNRQYWDDSQLNFEFLINYREFRDYFEKEADLVYHLPLIGMLYSTGFQNYILIGCIVYLLSHKKYKELIMLTPAIFTVLLCLFSPVNAYLRYMLPTMVTMPINIAWCHFSVLHKKNNDDNLTK